MSALTYKIGDQIVPCLGIIDWRHPIANGYFKTRPGEDFDLEDFYDNSEGPGKLPRIEGKILDRTSIRNKSRSIISAMIKTSEGEQKLIAEGDQFILLSEQGGTAEFFKRYPIATKASDSNSQAAASGFGRVSKETSTTNPRDHLLFLSNN